MPVNYDDKSYNYKRYWAKRSYENSSEKIALQRLLPKKGESIIDIGSGFGRLLPSYMGRFKKITLFDSSEKLLSQAEKYVGELSLQHVDFINGNIYELSNLTDKKYDLALMVRVSHHLEDIDKAVEEVSNILDEDGIFILEVANKMHFKAVVKNLLNLNLNFFSRKPYSQATGNVTFLNYHPKRVEEILTKHKFEIETKLSVSNLRSPLLKKILPVKFLLILEGLLQRPLAYINFGPSIFIKAKYKQRESSLG